MVLEETLKHHFQTLGVNVDDKVFLGKCLDLCDLYNVSEEVLVEMWVAFVVEKNAALEPTLELLGQMERLVLKQTDKHSSILDVQNRGKTSASTVQSSRTKQQYTDNEDILGMYGYKGDAPLEAEPLLSSQVKSQAKRLRSPDEADATGARESKIRALETNVFTADIAQQSLTPRRIIGVESSKNIVEKYGRDVSDWKNTDKTEVRIAKSTDPHVQPHEQYMFTVLASKAIHLKRACQAFGAKLCSAWSHGRDDEIATTLDVRTQSDTIFRTWGRLRSMAEEEFTVDTVELEGCKIQTREADHEAVTLDLTFIPSYSIFPGQVIVVEGTNPTGNVLVAQKIFTSGYKPDVKSEPITRLEFPINLHVMVAVGPFTDHDDLDYKPLIRLMDNVAEMEPHVLILIGPFVPVHHTAIRDPTILITYQELFEQIIEKITKYTKGKCTQVALIPSFLDAHHDPVYPTPEFFLPQSMRSSNLHLLTDPCMIDIEGLTIGTTSVDIIRHLSKVEINRNWKGLKCLPRMMNYVLSQSCFYPLYPPSKEVNLDTSFWEKYGMIHRRPHILIIPSDMKHIIKCIDGCLAINPQRLNKHMYARMIIRPACNGPWTSDLVDCELLKI